MAIRLVEQLEGARVRRAESVASSRFQQELTRYANRGVLGRSFLISGHRGAGKTTLVEAALSDMRGRTLWSKFLKVDIHGPSLVRPSKPRIIAAATPTGHLSEEQGEEVLRHVTVALYQAAADLFWHEYRDRVLEHSGFSHSREEALEIAAQLRVELDGAPPLSTLRAFWNRIGRLNSGVLFPSRRDPLGAPPLSTLRAVWDRIHRVTLGVLFPSRHDPLGAPPLSTLRAFWDRIHRLTLGVLSPSRRDPPEGQTGPRALDQGPAELVALASAAQAYRVVTGRLEEIEEERAEGEFRSAIAFEAKFNLKDAVNSVTGLLAGAAVGLSYFVQSGRDAPMLAAAAGVATTVLTTSTLGLTSSRSRGLTRRQEVKFLPDRSIRSLMRMLPRLVQRFHECGLAPVFVVDELDKVPHLEEELLRIVRHMKAFFAENAFFCFLTHREYMEHLVRTLRVEPYSDLHTAFTNRTFVMYRPDALHEYISGTGASPGVLRIESSDSGGSQSLIDLEILSYALLQRSRMHPFDLVYEIRSLLDASGNVALPEGAIANNLGYRFSAMMQVAVEVVLQDQLLADRIREDLQFAQMAYDALYYPSKIWALGERLLDVSHASLMDAICSRTVGEPVALPELDRELLYSKVRRLIHLVRNPQALKEELVIATLKVPQSVLDAFPALPLLELEHEGIPDVYVFLCNPQGNPFITADVASIDTPELADAEDFIEHFEGALSSVVRAMLRDPLSTPAKENQA